MSDQTVKRISDTVARAVDDAERLAGNDDQAFFDQLQRGVAAAVPRDVSPARSVGGAAPQPKPPKVRNDPRYLKNLREVTRLEPNARVIGGTPVVGEFEDCVAVGDDTQFACTGTLIAPDVVLTAGHCRAFHTRVFVGTDVTKQGRIFKIRKHVPHPKFDRDTLVNDLTILFLDKKVTGVKPRKVAPKALIDNATAARVVGFGSTSLDGMGILSAKLAANVPIVSTSCSGTMNGETDEAFYGCHLNKELVAGKPMSHFDTCKGDSGGPLYIQDANQNWLLAGATSRGVEKHDTMCGDGGTYVRVDAYSAWIKSVLDGDKPSAPARPKAKARAKTKSKPKAKPTARAKAKTKAKAKATAKSGSRSRAKAKSKTGKKGKGR